MIILAKDSINVIDAIKLQQDCLSIVALRADSYDIKLSVLMDLNKILLNKCFKVKFRISQVDDSLVDSQIINTLSEGNISKIQQLKNDFLNSRIRKVESILEKEFDITTAINNSTIHSDLKENTPNIIYQTLLNLDKNSRINFQSDENEFAQQQIKVADVAYKLMMNNSDVSSKLRKVPLNDLLESTKSINSNINRADLTEQEIQYIDSYKQLFKKLSLDNDDLIPTIYSDTSSILRFSNITTVSPKDFYSNRLYVYVDLINVNGETVQTASQIVNFQKLLNLFKSITKHPDVKIGRASFPPGYLAVEVKGNLDHTNKCDLHTKSIGDTLYETKSVIFKNDFSFYLKFPMIKQSTLVKSNYSAVRGISNQGYNFGSGIFSNPRQKSLSGFVIAQQINQNINLLVNNLHPLTTGVTFYVLDKTLKSKPQKINDSIRLNGITTAHAVHVNPFPRHVYEYYCVSHLSDGTTIKSKSDIIECFLFKDAGIKVNYSNLIATEDDLTFDIVLKNIESTTDKIFNFIRSRQLESYFAGNLSDQVLAIRKLLSFIVFRINLSNGNRDYMGFFVDGENFSDKTASAMQGANSLSKNTDYIYQVFVSMTDPSTIFSNQIETIKSDNQMQSYAINSQKFKNSFTKLNSMLITPNGLKNKLPGTLFSHDILFTISIPVNVTLKKVSSDITHNIIVHDNKTYVQLKWQTITSSSKIDYFLISKFVSGRFNFVGRCINQDNGNMLYVDEVDQYGNIFYSITPVHDDGTFGVPILKTVKVNPPTEQVI